MMLLAETTAIASTYFATSSWGNATQFLLQSDAADTGERGEHPKY